MSRQIDKWVAEHRNFEKLLKIMEQQLAMFHRGERPNYALMLDIVYYMTHYPDQFHHPVEDSAFRRVGDKHASVRNLIEELHSQHRVIIHSGKALQERLDAVVNGVVLQRTLVEQAAQKYIDHLRCNMRQEERILFPLAQEVLQDEDWELIDRRAPADSDPLFGDRVPERYRTLHRQIARDVGCDCAVA